MRAWHNIWLRMIAGAFLVLASSAAVAATASRNQDSETDDVKAAILELMQSQVPVADLIGEYRLLIVGAPGASDEESKRLWEAQLDGLSPFAAGTLERRLLIINDSTRQKSPEMDRLFGSVMVTMAESGVAEVKFINLRDRPDLRPDFMGEWQAILVGLDGSVKKRWDRVVSDKEVFAVIDAMPMRQREIGAGR